MKTNRRDFLTSFTALLCTLFVTNRPAQIPDTPKIAVKPKPTTAPKPVASLWQARRNTQTVCNHAGDVVGIVEYNDREEFSGPIEFLNMGGRFPDGICVIKEKTVEFRYGLQHVTVKATRYPKVL